MLISDETKLNEDFERLRQRLDDPDALNPAHADPIFYLVFDSRHILLVRQELPGWIARIRNENGLNVETISVADILWKIIDDSGRWDSWVELEEQFEIEDTNEAIRSILRDDDRFINAVVARVEVVPPDTVIFMTDIESLHPFYRSRHIENALTNKAKYPIVFLYPGHRAGQHGLRFLGFYPEDSGYRSTIIGGDV